MPDPTADQNLLRARLLGRGLRCEEILPGVDLGRDLVLAPGPGGLDFAWVGAMDCLNQDLAVALTTALGSDLFNTAFGFDGVNALVEETDPVLMRERIRVSVIRVVAGDPRVRRVLDVKLPGGQLESGAAGGGGDAGFVPATRRMNIRVAFETVSADSAAVDLGGLIAQLGSAVGAGPTG